MIVKLLTEHYLEFQSFIGGYRGSSESTLVKMPNCWKCYETKNLSQYPHTTRTEDNHQSSHSHTGKCVRRFAGIYTYYRYFIDRMW